MNLYKLSASPYGKQRVAKFLEDNFVCIGWPGIERPEMINKDQVKEELEAALRLGDQERITRWEAVQWFVYGMQDGDYVLVPDGEHVHLGDLGDYFYDEFSDPDEDHMKHRRGVTWLACIPRIQLNGKVQDLLDSPGWISIFNDTLDAAQLGPWLAAVPAAPGEGMQAAHVDEKTVALAVEILKQALHSEDAMRRERAAIAILQYAK